VEEIMKRFVMTMVLVLACGGVLAVAQSGAGAAAQGAAALTDGDREAIKNAALDYAMGWYEGNGERMERALHPELAKRIVRTNPQGQSSLGQMSAMTLVQFTRSGGGKNTPADQRQADVRILDAFEGTAMVRTEMREWVDFMQMAKWNGQWKIVNVLWQMKPRPAA
jgi:hypothetical protein